jgi:hypothetical protein
VLLHAIKSDDQLRLPERKDGESLDEEHGFG